MPRGVPISRRAVSTFSARRSQRCTARRLMATPRGTRLQPTTDGKSMKTTRAALYATNLYQMVFYNDCCAVDHHPMEQVACASERGGNNLKPFKGVLPASHDQYLALTFSCVPSLLDSGPSNFGSGTSRSTFGARRSRQCTVRRRTAIPRATPSETTKIGTGWPT